MFPYNNTIDDRSDDDEVEHGSFDDDVVEHGFSNANVVFGQKDVDKPSKVAQDAANWIMHPELMLTKMTDALNGVCKCCRYHFASDGTTLHLKPTQGRSAVVLAALQTEPIVRAFMLAKLNGAQAPFEIDVVLRVRQFISPFMVHEFTAAVWAWNESLRLLADWIVLQRLVKDPNAFGESLQSEAIWRRASSEIYQRIRDNLRSAGIEPTSEDIATALDAEKLHPRELLTVKQVAEKLKAYASLYDLELLEIIEDAGQSAKSLKRPGLQRALQMLRNGEADGIIIVKLDRLTRSVRDWQTLIDGYFGEKAGKSLCSVTDSIDTRTAAGRLVLNVLLSVAQWEREAIGERIRDALQHKRRMGKRPGQLPLGFDLADDGDTLILNSREQAIVELMTLLREDGLSYHKIAAILQRKRVPTKEPGSTWAAMTV